jgi:hypothetical protein
MPPIERSQPPAPVVDPETERREREATYERRRQHLERQAAIDAARIKEELAEMAARLQRPNGQG